MSSAALSEVYHNPAVVSEAVRWRDMWASQPEGMLGVIGPLGHISTQFALLNELEALDNDSSQRKAMVTLLSSLPTATLTDTYGEAITAWVLANDDLPSRILDHFDDLEELGHDSAALRDAVYVSRITSSAPTSGEVLANKAIMHMTLDGGLAQLDLPKLLSRNTWPGMMMSDKQAADYELIPLTTDINKYCITGKVRNWKNKKYIENRALGYDLWVETPASFALTHKGHPQTVTSLRANGAHELFIRQLQGTHGTRYDMIQQADGSFRKEVVGHRGARGLVKIDMRKFLVETVAEMARQLGLESVGIVKGKDVPTMRINLLTHAQAHQAYDVEAERLGFTRGADSHWHKAVSDFDLA